MRWQYTLSDGSFVTIHFVSWKKNTLHKICGSGEDKSPIVPFHGITSTYSYFKEIWIFTPIKQEAKHDQEKLSAELTWKVCWQNPGMFCLFTHQAKIQICSRVKLIPWNVVDLSHVDCSNESTNSKPLAFNQTRFDKMHIYDCFHYKRPHVPGLTN